MCLCEGTGGREKNSSGAKPQADKNTDTHRERNTERERERERERETTYFQWGGCGGEGCAHHTVKSNEVVLNQQ